MIQLSASDPDVIVCKQAAKKLLDQLYQTYGRQPFTGVGVCSNTNGTGPAIRLNLLNNSLLTKIPSEFEGWEIHPIVTGEIKAL